MTKMRKENNHFLINYFQSNIPSTNKNKKKRKKMLAKIKQQMSTATPLYPSFLEFS